VLERVLKTIIRYSMFGPGDRVGVAVSGGADSVFLLHALVELGSRWDLKLSVLHLDHGLRGGESREDAQFVADLARRFGLSAHIAESDVAGLKQETGDNLEQAGRRARRRFYMEFLDRKALDRIATGHTRSDQAETVLFRFFRGSGTAGLSGIRPVTSEGLVRPLIELERADIECYLRDKGIAWREDSTNASREFARNRIRHELLPGLIRDWNPALAENLAHTAQWAQDEEAYWEAEIDRLALDRLTIQPPAVLLRSGELCGLPPAVARRLVRRAIELTKGDLRGICFQHVERILEMAEAPEGHDRMQAPGLDVMRSFEWIRLAPPRQADLVGRNFRLTVSVPGRFRLPDSSSTLELELIESARESKSVYNSEMAGLDWERVGSILELRNWRPGDQYRPVGHANEEKIKVLFQEARVPVWERRNWPILTIGEDIVWARRFGPASSYAATLGSRSVVKVWEERA
jgi:tRNA(Ile)-lysidine synthase